MILDLGREGGCVIFINVYYTLLYYCIAFVLYCILYMFIPQ